MNSNKEQEDSPPVSSDGRLELSSDRESNLSQEIISIDYLNDLERQISPEELKAFILQSLNERVLLPKDVMNLIEEGAEINRFTQISEDVKDLLVRSLQITFDHQLPVSLGDRFKSRVQQVITAKRLIKGGRSRRVSLFAAAYREEELQETHPYHANKLKALARQFRRNLCLRDQLSKAYLCVGLLILSSIFVFFGSSLLVPTSLRQFAGPGIVISRAAAIVILVYTTLSVVCISRDLNTCLRKGCCGRRCEALLDEHIMYHKVCGYIAIVYSLFHTIGHLFGGVNAIANADSVEEINQVLTHKKFQRKLSYLELAFTTLPGITGCILLTVAIKLWACSLPCVRRRKWEMFSYTHMLYYVFVIGMVVHGADTWLNPGFPLSFPFSAISLGFIFFTVIRRQLQAKTQPCEVVQVLSAPDLSFIYLKLKRSPGLVIEPGQYMMINLPHYSRLQWHPFSVCSGRDDSTVNFIIKNNGNFSRFLIYLFKEGWKEMKESFSEIPKNKKKKLAIIEPESKLEFVRPSFRRFKEVNNLKAYRLNLSGPFGAPCQSAAYKENVVLIGAGIGITPYLAFLRTLPPQINHMKFVFIVRDPELMRWISLTLKEQKFSPEQQRRLNISLYLTRRKETHCLATFLFWRAFLALKKKQEHYGSTKDMIFDAPMSVSYKRPDLKAILREEGKRIKKAKPVSVYSCAPHSMNERLRSICREVSQEMEIKFDFYPEIFS